MLMLYRFFKIKCEFLKLYTGKDECRSNPQPRWFQSEAVNGTTYRIFVSNMTTVSDLPREGTGFPISIPVSKSSNWGGGCGIWRTIYGQRIISFGSQSSATTSMGTHAGNEDAPDRK